MLKRYRVGPRMSQAVAADGLLYVGGQVADDTETGVEEQTADVLRRFDSPPAEGGTDKSGLVAMNVCLSNIADFDAMNTVYDHWVDPTDPPMRAGVEALADTSDTTAHGAHKRTVEQHRFHPRRLSNVPKLVTHELRSKRCANTGT